MLCVTIYNTLRYGMTPDYEKLVRRPPPTLALDRRIGIAEVEQNYPEPNARRQAGVVHAPGRDHRRVQVEARHRVAPCGARVP